MSHRSLNAEMEHMAQQYIDKFEKDNGEILVPEGEKYLR